MRGKVICRLLGGPKGEETLIISAMACRERSSVVGDVWAAQGQDGKVRIMKGAHAAPRAVDHVYHRGL